MSRDDDPKDDEPPRELTGAVYESLGGKVEGVKVTAPRPAMYGNVYPISRACPSCGSEDHRKVDPKTFIAFTWDRVCKRCGTRYTPPTPRWGGLAACALGLVALLLLLGVTVWVYYNGMGSPVIVSVMAYATGVGVICVSFSYGIWLLRRSEPGIVLPPAGVAEGWKAGAPRRSAGGEPPSQSDGIARAGPYTEAEPPT